MASDVPSSALMHFPHDTSCDTCEKGNPAEWACRECVQNLCDECKDSHKRISFTKNHNVTSLFERAECGPGRSIMCEEHDEPIVLFCKPCSKEICQKCQTKAHNGHGVKEIADKARLIRSEIQKTFDDKRAMIERARNRMQDMLKAKQEYLEDSNSSIENVKTELEKLFNDFKRDARKCVETLREKYQNNEAAMTRQCQDLESTIDQAEMEVNENFVEFRRHPDVGLHEFWKKQLKSKLDGVCIDLTDEFSYPAVCPLNIHAYAVTVRKAMTDILTVISGDHDEEPRMFVRKSADKTARCLRHSFSLPSDVRVFSLAVETTSQKGAVWVGLSYKDDFRVELFDTNGETVRGKSLNFPPLHVLSTEAASNASDASVGHLLIASEVHAPAVRVLKGNGHISDFKDTSPYFPYGMCITNDGHIVVCLQKAEFSGKIIELSSEGHTLKETYIEQYTPTEVIQTTRGLIVKSESLLVQILPKSQKVIPVSPEYTILSASSDEKGRVFGACSMKSENKSILCLIDQNGTYKHLCDITFGTSLGTLCKIACDSQNKLIWICSVGGSIQALCFDNLFQ